MVTPMQNNPILYEIVFFYFRSKSRKHWRPKHKTSSFKSGPGWNSKEAPFYDWCLVWKVFGKVVILQETCHMTRIRLRLFCFFSAHSLCSRSLILVTWHVSYKIATLSTCLIQYRLSLHHELKSGRLFLTLAVLTFVFELIVKKSCPALFSTRKILFVIFRQTVKPLFNYALFPVSAQL